MKGVGFKASDNTDVLLNMSKVSDKIDFTIFMSKLAEMGFVAIDFVTFLLIEPNQYNMQI